MRPIAAVVGSLRRESMDLRLARAPAKIGAPQLLLKVDAADAVLFVTRESKRTSSSPASSRSSRCG